MPEPLAPDALSPVLICGTGLIGTSVGLALARAGIAARLSDTNPAALRVAAGRGAGRQADIDGSDCPPRLVVVATPPADLSDEIVGALRAHPDAVVTDVGSVKAEPLAEVTARLGRRDCARYVGGHPMAGSERSGPMAAAADIFDGRSWAVTPAAEADPAAVAMVELLAVTCGSAVVRMAPVDHDRAVARMSHLPHLMAVLTAARLVDAPDSHLRLGGQGIRDVTRIAAGDPVMWRQIVVANAAPLRELLADLRVQLEILDGSLAGPNLEAADTGALDALLAAGVAGTNLLPGKHNRPARPLVTVTVQIPDEPGSLAALFTTAAAAEVNIEDLRIDHDPGRAFGLVEIDVVEDRADALIAALRDNTWPAHR